MARGLRGLLGLACLIADGSGSLEHILVEDSSSAWGVALMARGRMGMDNEGRASARCFGRSLEKRDNTHGEPRLERSQQKQRSAVRLPCHRRSSLPSFAFYACSSGGLCFLCFFAFLPTLALPCPAIPPLFALFVPALTVFLLPRRRNTFRFRFSLFMRFAHGLPFLCHDCLFLARFSRLPCFLRFFSAFFCGFLQKPRVLAPFCEPFCKKRIVSHETMQKFIIFSLTSHFGYDIL